MKMGSAGAFTSARGHRKTSFVGVSAYQLWIGPSRCDAAVPPFAKGRRGGFAAFPANAAFVAANSPHSPLNKEGGDRGTTTIVMSRFMQSGARKFPIVAVIGLQPSKFGQVAGPGFAIPL